MSIVISIVGICLIIVLLSFGNPGDRFSILLNRDFLKAFGLFAVQTGLAAIIGGGMGAILAGLIQRSDKLFEPVTRLLRLGHWLPFFVLWALPGWKAPRVFQADVAASETLVVGTIIVVPLIFISSVYFRLRSTVSITGHKNLRNRRSIVAKSVFLYATLICILWQMWLPSLGWPWHWFALNPYPSIGFASLFLIALLVWTIKLCSRIGFQNGLDARRAAILWEIKPIGSRSLGSATVIVVGFILFWHFVGDSLKSYLLFAPPSEVVRAIYGLLMTGSKALPQTGATIWGDIGVSLLEISVGLAIAGILAHLFLALHARFERSRRIVSLALSHSEIAPIGLWMVLLVTVPGFIAFWSKPTLVACLAFYTISHTLLCFDDYVWPSRVTLAIEQALPFAFVGMVFGEMFGSTGGLAFVLAVTSSTSMVADTIATSVITFVLLIVISSALRFLAKRFANATTMASVVAPVTTNT